MVLVDVPISFADDDDLVAERAEPAPRTCRRGTAPPIVRCSRDCAAAENLHRRLHLDLSGCEEPDGGVDALTGASFQGEAMRMRQVSDLLQAGGPGRLPTGTANAKADRHCGRGSRRLQWEAQFRRGTARNQCSALTVRGRHAAAGEARSTGGGLRNSPPRSAL